MSAEHVTVLSYCVLAFSLGSIPFGLLVARAFGAVDPREAGSGNIGATNISRVVGFWPAGFLTFVLDLAKGSLPTLIAMPYGQKLVDSTFGVGAVPYAGFAWFVAWIAVLGHCFSPWLKFRGGKGVATGFGVLLVLSPIAALIGILGFAAMFLFSRQGSLASLTGLALASVAQLVLYPLGGHLTFLALITWVILTRHDSNLDSLLSGEERAFVKTG